jgi:predicted enzyme related to lactoylglutathione lyase
MPIAESTLTALGVAPILTVNDLDRSLRFYQGLGFGIERRYERDGQLRGLMVRAGDARINLAQDDWAQGRDRVKGVGVRLFIVTHQDIDQLAAKVKEAGVRVDSGPEDMPWGRSFALTDPDGFKVTVAHEP